MSLAVSTQPRARTAGWQIGLVVTLVLVLVAFASVVWTPYPVQSVDAAAIMQPPTNSHLLGTDGLGHDVLSLLLRGMLTSFVVAAVAVAVGAVIGVPLGLAAAGWGAVADAFVRAIGGYIAIVPAFAVAALLALRFGPSPGTAMVALGFGMVPAFVAATRATLRAAPRHGYAVAAQLAGALPLEIVRRYSLPAFTRAIGAEMVAQLAVGVLGEAALAFVGLGATAPATSLGLMLREAQQGAAGQPMLVVAPGLLLLVIVLALSVTSRGLRAQGAVPASGATDAA